MFKGFEVYTINPADVVCFDQRYNMPSELSGKVQTGLIQYI